MLVDVTVPFSKWPKTDLDFVINKCLNEHDRLLRIPQLDDTKFRYMKREFVQSIVDHIYSEIFVDHKFTELTLKEGEIDSLWAFAKDFVAFKIKVKEPGWSRDKKNGERRVFTGAAGHLAVLKSMGGDIGDMDLSLGESKKYDLPDLEDWLGFKVGVKTASVIDYTPKYYRKVKSVSNLPLVLDYKNFNETKIKKWKKDNTRYEERHGIEAQVIVATKDFFRQSKKGSGREIYKTKCYILGVVRPEVLINYASTAFTLDPNAANDKKPGGAKAGFYGLHKIKYFSSKEELIDIVSKDEYQLISYEDILGYADMNDFWNYNNKQDGI